MNRRHCLAFCLVLGATVFNSAASSQAPEIAVIVNKSNGNASLTRAQIAAIFKGRSAQFPDGAGAIPINLPGDSPVRQHFDEIVLGLKPSEVERYWIDNKIRFGIGEPRKVSSPGAVVRFVAANAAGIGYVLKSDATSDVRVVARVRNREVVGP